MVGYNFYLFQYIITIPEPPSAVPVFFFPPAPPPPVFVAPLLALTKNCPRPPRRPHRGICYAPLAPKSFGISCK